MKLRIKFAKYGAVKFIGHLDMMRFFQKAIRRAGIDIRYSEGFSPHQVMSFAAPLGVGVESFGEYLDIEVLSMKSTEEVKRALNQEMAEGVEILSVTELSEGAGNAMASVAAASYLLRMKEGHFPVEDLSASLAAFFAKPCIPYVKETKKGQAEVDLKEGIYELFATEKGEIQMLLNAKSGENIKPLMVFDAFSRFMKIEIPSNGIQVIRLETYGDAGEKGGGRRFVPLNEV